MSYEKVIPADNTLIQGIKTVMADKREKSNVRYVRDVEYVKRGELPLHLQLLMPEGTWPDVDTSKRFPLIVYVQGSAWGEQNVYDGLPRLVSLARKGYVVASVKHRSSAVAKFPAFLQDVKSAIRFMRANAERFHVAPEKVAVWGDSSGGHAALMTGVTGDMEEFKTEDNCEISDSVCAVVDFYGPTDVTQINNAPRNPLYTADKEHIPEDILFGGCVAEHPEIAQPGNPINYVTKDKELPPFLIMHGDIDSMVPFNQSVLMYRKLTECNQTAEFYRVMGAEHGSGLWTDEVLDIVVKFLGAYMDA